LYLGHCKNSAKEEGMAKKLKRGKPLSKTVTLSAKKK
jgi:hypothetical protein